jgi:hypothetical protein
MGKDSPEPLPEKFLEDDFLTKLIQLGSWRPSLRDDLRKILEALEKEKELQKNK